MKFTIIYTTSRTEPEFQWFYDSVRRESDCEIIVIQTGQRSISDADGVSFRHPKPTVWQGPHRLTKEDWWAKSNALNTGYCLCRTEWVMCADDRSVLLPGWLNRVEAAMGGGYGVCGSYEKRIGMEVKNGMIVNPGTVSGPDCRLGHMARTNGGTIMDCPGEWWFGCVNALPLEWVMQVNGHEELMDGLSFEDCIFGLMLKNNGFPLKFDRELQLIEDRTPDKCGPALRRSSKERFPHDKEDKGHKALARFGVRKRSEHHWDLREIRQSVLRGGQFPPATKPTVDWFDGQPITEMI